jgi:hypothetical protein
VELLVSLALAGVVVVAVHGVMLESQRVHGRQAGWVEVNSTLRLAAALVSLELAGLDAGDTASSDLIELAPHEVTYRALRSTTFLCRPPEPIGPGSWHLVVAAEPRFGPRLPEPERDLLRIYAEADRATARDNYWARADLESVWASAACPGGGQGYELTVRNVRPPAALGGVERGAPVAALELSQLRSYRDRHGDWWLGSRRKRRSGGWSGTQPVLGPLVPGGIRFTYRDQGGAQTAEPNAVARIGIAIVARRASGTPQPDSVAPGDSITLLVALRNNPRPDRQDRR